MTARASSQRGQALAEGALVLAALAGLLWAVRATGAWHDEAMQAGLAARQAAFAHARGALTMPDDLGFAGSLAFSSSMPGGLPDRAQPGGEHPHAAQLRREWRLHEADPLAARATLPASHAALAGAPLAFTRHVTVLRDAGHASHDADAQRRTGQSGLGWRAAAEASIAAGRAVAARMAPVDRPWSRPAPRFDWLGDWTGAVPPELLWMGAVRP